MRGILNWIRTHYNNTAVIVTENGVTDHNGTLHDSHRIDYLRNYIDELIKGRVVALAVQCPPWSDIDELIKGRVVALAVQCPP